MSDTPRTDQMFSTETALSDGELVVPISFARQLERENAALRDAIAESEEFAKKNGETCGLKIRDLLSENAALADENRRLHVELDAYHNGEQLRHMRAENAGLRGALEESQEYGRNHANAVMKLLSVISRIRFAVDSQPQRSQAMRLEDVGDLCDEVLGKKEQP